MARKTKERVAPCLELDLLTESFAEQLPTGVVSDAITTESALPSLQSRRGNQTRIDRCVLQAVTLSDRNAQLLHLHDTRIQSSDLANIKLTGSSLERLEIVSTRLTGAIFTEAQLKSVLFRECKLALGLFRMARLQQCILEQCNLTETDFYGADLSGVVFRDRNLTRADLSQPGSSVLTCAAAVWMVFAARPRA